MYVHRILGNSLRHHLAIWRPERSVFETAVSSCNHEIKCLEFCHWVIHWSNLIFTLHCNHNQLVKNKKKLVVNVRKKCLSWFIPSTCKIMDLENSKFWEYWCSQGAKKVQVFYNTINNHQKRLECFNTVANGHSITAVI